MSSQFIKLPEAPPGVGSGTVTSVDVSTPGGLLVSSGGPITDNGIITLTLANESANKVFSGPATGAAATPTFRDLVAADIPTIVLSTSQVSGVLPASKGGAGPLGAITYVDNGRLDSFTPDGSLSKPYLTIQAAINAIAAGTGVGSIIVAGGGAQYAENITFNDAGLTTIQLYTESGAIIAPASGNVVDSSSNNTQLTVLGIIGFQLVGGVNLVGSGAGNNFLLTQAFIQNCIIRGNIVVSSCGQPSFLNADIEGNLSLLNVNGTTVRDGRVLNGSVSIQTNLAGVLPSGFSDTELYLENVLVIGANLTIDSDSYVQFRRGTRFGASGGTLTIQSGGELEVYDSDVRSNIVNNAGGMLTLHSGFYQGTLTNNGTYVNKRTASQIAYAPADTSKWANPQPTTTQQALDRIAAVVGVTIPIP